MLVGVHKIYLTKQFCNNSSIQVYTLNVPVVIMLPISIFDFML